MSRKKTDRYVASNHHGYCFHCFVRWKSTGKSIAKPTRMTRLRGPSALPAKRSSPALMSESIVNATRSSRSRRLTKTPPRSSGRPKRVSALFSEAMTGTKANSVPVGQGPLSLGRPPQARVERVAQRVPEEVEREHGDEDPESRSDARPPLQIREPALRVVHVGAPGRRRRLRAEPEERQCRLGEDREGDRERRLHDEGVRDVREHVTHHDPQPCRSDRPGRGHVLALTDGQHLAAREAGV